LRRSPGGRGSAMARRQLTITKSLGLAPPGVTVDYLSRASRPDGTSLPASGPAAALVLRLRNRLRVINVLFATLFGTFVLLALLRILSDDPKSQASGWRSLRGCLPSVLC